MTFKFPVLLSAFLLGACAATAPTPSATTAADSGGPDLACPLSSNCVSTRGNGDLQPLLFAGTAARAMDILRATIATFPEASVVRAEPLALEVIFTTPAGFKDQVDLRIDPQAQRVDFRSRSMFGLFDWGKNRSRMQEFKSRFDRQARL
jgi:uncharacterized protein (DUF1499 family)